MGARRLSRATVRHSQGVTEPSTAGCGSRVPGARYGVIFSIHRWLKTLCLVLAGVWLVGCASDEPPPSEPDTRARIDQILSPQGSKPNDAYTKRSRYDGQGFRSKSLEKRSFAGSGSDGKAREGEKDFTAAGGLRARWAGQGSRFGSEDAQEGGQSARTFASRHEDQEARTKAFGGATDQFRTREARQSDDAFYTGRSRDFSTRTLGATQLSPMAAATAEAYPAQATGPLNEEEVRRVLNKGPRER